MKLSRYTRRVVRRKKSSGYFKTGSGSLGPRLLQLGYNDYSAYLSGDHWQIIRDRLIAVRGARCEICDATDEPLNRTYERFGRELDDDLILLCLACHDGVHHRESVGVGLEDALSRRIKVALPRNKRNAARIRGFWNTRSPAARLNYVTGKWSTPESRTDLRRAISDDSADDFLPPPRGFGAGNSSRRLSAISHPARQRDP